MPDGSPIAIPQWYTAADLAGLPDLPSTARRVLTRADAEGWTSRPRARGKGLEYSIDSLPAAARAALLLRHGRATLVANTADTTSAHLAGAAERYARLSETQRAAAERRASAVAAVQDLVRSGMGAMDARKLVAAELQREQVRGASVASLCRWAADVKGAPRDAWAGLLAAQYTGRTVQAECDPRALDWYAGQYLTRRQPSHADTYDRLRKVAAKEGWTLPSARTLIRRLDETVDRVTQVYKREGPEAAARLIPTQDRDELVFAAGQAVNGDGLKLDTLWVRFEDGEVINTATCWMFQDVRTRRILSWRLAKTENTDVFRLATYDLTAVCAPELVWIDNTRVAANKLMTGGATNRHRFKSDPEDGEGLLRMLGMEPRFTHPDKLQGNPGAKPIERAFGQGGLHAMIATHPRFANRGYSKASAIGVAELREVVAEEVARHNARTGRRTRACNGVLSFDQAWAESIAQSAPRVLSESQRKLLLTCREVVTVDRAGVATIKAGQGPMGRNRYHSDATARLAEQKVVVHYDPENLAADVYLYSLDGRFLCKAEHYGAKAFHSTDASREHAKFKARRIKAQKAAADAATRMDELERAALYAAAQEKPADPAPADPKVVRANFKRVADPVRDAQRATGTDGAAAAPSALDRMMRERVRKLREENEF